jgi:hypothetical protein
MFEKGNKNNPFDTARIIQQRRRAGIDEFKGFREPLMFERRWKEKWLAISFA